MCHVFHLLKINCKKANVSIFLHFIFKLASFATILKSPIYIFVNKFYLFTVIHVCQNETDLNFLNVLEVF